eukprot:6478231-Amphidinium_carterae.1
MPPKGKKISRRPAGSLKPQWSDRAGGSSCSIWEYMEAWQEGSAGQKVCPLLATGHLLELVMLSSGGRAMGHIIVKVIAVHPSDYMGTALEAERCGASNRKMQDWLSQAFQLAESPVFHLCSGKNSKDCGFHAGQRLVIHSGRWRVRNPLKIREAWFVAPREPIAPAP